MNSQFSLFPFGPNQLNLILINGWAKQRNAEKRTKGRRKKKLQETEDGEDDDDGEKKNKCTRRESVMENRLFHVKTLNRNDNIQDPQMETSE